MARKVMGTATMAVARAVEVLWSDAPPEPSHLVVACSGGPDSLALAAVTQLVAARHSCPVTAMVVDHGLQPGSAQVAESARDQLTGRDLRTEIIQVALERTGGPEAAARTARYAALTGAAQALQALVLLGHTLDDQAETVLLGLARGSGARSLSGMSGRRGIFWRPLLDLRRSVTRAACAELGLAPWHDPHNDSPDFARVRVRQAVLPTLEAQLGPGIAEALARSADQLRDDADLLDALAATAYDQITSPAGLPCAGLAELAPSLRRRVLLRYLGERGARDVGAVHLAAVDRLVMRWHGQHGVDLPGLRVVRERGHLVTVAG